MMTFIDKSQPRETVLTEERPRDVFRNGMALDISAVANLARAATRDADEWLAQLDAKSLPTLIADLGPLEKSLRQALAVVRATSVRTADHMTGKSRL